MEYIWEDYDQYYEPEYIYEQAAPLEESGGCLLGLLPPLAVILVSCVLAFLAVNWTSPVIAISINKDNPSAQAQSAPASQVAKESGSSKSSGKLAPFFSKEVLYWQNDIIKWSKQYKIDPNLVATVMQIESCGDPKAQSYAGASGLFQVMPYHFASGENPFDPNTNAQRGLTYLVSALQAVGEDARLALAGYNGGIAGASRPDSQWPAETQRYAYWGSGIYTDAAKGKKQSARLDEWLAAGGSGLCAQASQRLGFTQ
jgi:soluble lytic murein transglycosylase-like protein